MNHQGSFHRPITWAVALIFTQLSGGLGMCQGLSGAEPSPIGPADTAREWIKVGRTVDEANPVWDELQAEIAQGFARALKTGLASLTNDLAGARRQFAVAAREAEQLGHSEQGQAQMGLDYVDALTALQQANSPDGFTSSWARVQETEAALPASWPRVGTNVAVRVVRSRIDTTLQKELRRATTDDSPASLLDVIETLEIISGVQRDNPRKLQNPYQNREARTVSAAELASYGPAYLQWLESVENKLKVDYPQEYETHRRDIERVRTRLTRY